jgi:hypothetical protein
VLFFTEQAASLVFLGLVMCLGTQVRADDQATAIEKRLTDSARYLSSDECEGRGLGTKGLDLAADFIAKQFSQYGLVTTTYAGEPFQQFTLLSNTRMGTDNKAALIKPPINEGDKPETIDLAIGKDYSPISLSGPGTVDVSLVFAGYGITADKEGYDDYASLDAAGKAVVILRHQPKTKPKDGSILNSLTYTTLDSKIENAEQHKAAAVIFCTDAAEVSKNVAAAQGEEDTDPVLTFYAGGRNRSAHDIPVIHCRRAALEPVFVSATGSGLDALEEKIDEGPAPQSRALAPWRISEKIDVQCTQTSLKNVVAVLEGQGPHSEETIVVGAHYDHLGYGGRYSMSRARAIHPGADDNASGTSVMLEVAHAMATRETKLQRRVVFVAFSAEEEGMLGSKYYVRHPAAPIEKTVAMINLDMVGRLRNEKLTIYGSQTAKEFNALLDKAGLVEHLGGDRPAEITDDSDHATFYKSKVPFLFFFTGEHPDYHTPSDKFETLNIEGMRRVARVAEEVLVEIANESSRPEFSKTGGR